MEPKIPGRFASGMLRTCASMKLERVLPVFLPHVCNVLTRVMADFDVTSDLYPGLGAHILPYVNQVEEVLKLVLKLQNKDGHQMSVSILRNLLLALAERAKLVSEPSKFPLDDWGRASDLSNLDVKWFIPGM